MKWQEEIESVLENFSPPPASGRRPTPPDDRRPPDCPFCGGSGTASRGPTLSCKVFHEFPRLIIVYQTVRRGLVSNVSSDGVPI